MRPLLLDVGGTLLDLAEPVDLTYQRLGSPWGVGEVDFRGAWKRRNPRLQQLGDGRPFWRALVADATKCNDLDYFELLYEHYASAEAWRVRPGAAELIEAHPSLAIVSNWDTRLPRTLAALGLQPTALVCSGELGVEKPDPRIFLEACARLGCAPAQAVHVGDSPFEDVEGARSAGIEAWLWGQDVNDFRELGTRLGV